MGNVTVSGGDGEIDNFATLTSWLSLTAGGDITIGNVDYSDYGTGAMIDVSGSSRARRRSSVRMTTIPITDNIGANAVTGGDGADIFNFLDANTGMALGSIDQILDFMNAAGDKIDFPLNGASL